jgi:signal transduction histidine kinase
VSEAGRERAPWRYTDRVEVKQIVARSAFKRLQRIHLEARTWIEIALGLLTFLAIILFYQSLLSPQISFANDRLALTSLRESWGQAATGFGLRNSHNPKEDFYNAYRDYRLNPAVKVLLQTDPEFAKLSAKANAAFSRLETGELRAERSTLQSAAEFDETLFQMALRVDEYAKIQLNAFRRSFVVTALGILVAIIGFIVLEMRLRASSAGEARNRALSRALIAAQEGERLRISHELHDAVAQDLAAANSTVVSARGRTPSKPPVCSSVPSRKSGISATGFVPRSWIASASRRRPPASVPRSATRWASM